MPALRQRERTLRTELQSIAEQTRERATYLRLAETLSAFLERLREAADTLDIAERQRIVRLVIKDVLVGDDTIVIRHCIPVPSAPPDGGSPQDSDCSNDVRDGRSYLLRTGSNHSALRCSPACLLPATHSSTAPLVGLLDRRLQPHLQQMQHLPIADAARDAPQEW
jgi:site-specific DNA recombinase